MENFNTILSNYLSPNSMIRSQAQNQLDQILLRGDPRDLDPLFDSLSKKYDNNVKLFLALLIKKVFESCINQENYQSYQEYVLSRKVDIVNTILNVNSDLKITNNLILVLEKCMGLFKEKIMINEEIIENKNTLDLCKFNPDEVFQYIFEFYKFNKIKGNLNETFHGLYISFKLLKFLKNWADKEKFDFKKTFFDFYENIIADFTEILGSFLSILSSNTLPNLYEAQLGEMKIIIQYINLFLKIAKHSVNFLLKEQRERIMDLTFQFLSKILVNSSTSSLSEKIFESIFLSNKILLKYTAYVSKIDVQTITKFSNLFYIYISETSIFDTIINIIRINYSNSLHSNSIYKENKFITDIIDFFKELLQLTSFDNWGDLILFKDCYSDDSIIISDYLTKEFFTEDRLRTLLIFAIKNCMTFRVTEIEMAMNDIEEFYTWYDTLSPLYDLREKAGLLCRIIYDKYKKSLKTFFENLELNLLELTEKECLQSVLSFEETNLKCAILYFFENLTYIYFNKHRNYEMWVKKILLAPLDLNFLKVANAEIFSRFIIIRILMKTVDFKEVSNYKSEIFMAIYNIFLNLRNKNTAEYSHYMLLKFAALDYFYAFFDDFFSKEIPSDFLENSIYNICEMLRCVSSPDIHNKIIKTTSTILNQFDDDKIEFAFAHIFPILNQLWENSWDNYLTTSTSNFRKNIQDNNNQLISISVVRQNLIKLISIFVKKIGIFISFNKGVNMNNDGSIVDIDYFRFVYNIIGYSISIKSKESNFLVQEALKLILLIQDEFYRLNCVNKNLSPKILNNPNNFPNDFIAYFQFYIKIYDFLPIILENLIASDDYFIVQLLIIEQFLSLIYISEVKTLFNSINLIEKIIFIIKNLYNKHSTIFWQPIFNFMEFCLYILNSSNLYKDINIPISIPIDQYNNFIYEVFQNIFLNFNQENLINLINSKSNESLILDVPELNFFLGALQLANRFIYINFYIYNNSSDNFYYSLANHLYFIINNKQIVDGISILNKKILTNLIKNLIKIFKVFGQSDNVNDLNNLLLQFDGSQGGNFLDKHNHTLNHWLFFFNKMNNNTYYYHFTVLEENLRAFWSAKLEKLNYFEVDLSVINFDLKYYNLLADDMYKKEDPDDDEPNGGEK